MVPLCCQKSATKGRRLLCAAADASLLPYVQSVSLCAPQSGFLAPARLLPGLFLKRVNDKGEARPIFRIQSTARRRSHVAQICDRLLGCKHLRHRRTDAYRRVRCKGRSLARYLELASLPKPMCSCVGQSVSGAGYVRANRHFPREWKAVVRETRAQPGAEKEKKRRSHRPAH